MARVVFTAFGSWGDVFPMLPVASALRARGHDIRFAVTPAGRHILEAEGYEVVPAGPRLGVEEFARHPEILDPRLRGVAGLIRLLRVFVVPHLADTAHEVAEAARGADLVVAHPIQLAGATGAEVAGTPWVTLSMFPSLLPTSYAPPQPLGALRGLPRAVNATAWSTLKAVGRALFDDPINHARLGLGLPPVRDAVLAGTLSPRRVVLLTSPRYTPRQPDWPAQVQMCGFTPFDTPAAWGPFDGVDEYLEAGPPPVIVTLGASVSLDPRDFFDAARSAMESLGLRGIFLVGHERNVPAGMGHRDGVWPFVPLSRVLPRAAAIVHHGGFGTSSATLAAGVPSVVVPRAFDQFHHADRTTALGVGTVVGWRGLRASRLARALERVLGDPAYRARAEELASALRTEDGPSRAADAIETALEPAVRSSM